MPYPGQVAYRGHLKALEGFAWLIWFVFLPTLQGNKTTLKYAVSKGWKDSFDSGGIMTGVGADHKVITGATERTLNQTQVRQEHYEAPRYFRNAPGSAICSCFTGGA